MHTNPHAPLDIDMHRTLLRIAVLHTEVPERPAPLAHGETYDVYRAAFANEGRYSGCACGQGICWD
jgi:hypothetical protein